VQGALSGVEGVTFAEVSLEEQRAVVTHTANTVKAEQLIKVIEEAGFKAKEESTEMETN
jgi:copper chaperone CopZ